MKKIKMVFVSILLVVAFLVGCAPDQKIYNNPTTEPWMNYCPRCGAKMEVQYGE